MRADFSTLSIVPKMPPKADLQGSPRREIPPGSSKRRPSWLLCSRNCISPHWQHSLHRQQDHLALSRLPERASQNKNQDTKALIQIIELLTTEFSRNPIKFHKNSTKNLHCHDSQFLMPPSTMNSSDSGDVDTILLMIRLSPGSFNRAQSHH